VVGVPYRSLCQRHECGGCRAEPVALPHQRDVKLVLDLQAAYLQAHGAVAVLATCSSIGPAVVIASQLVDVPVLRIDEPMASAAIETGRRIGVLATVASTLNPTVDLLRRRAQDLRKDVEITPVLRDRAFTAMRSGDGARHDEIVREALMDLAADVDVIVLAQASMARVVATLEPGVLCVPVLSSPSSGMARLASVLA